MAAANKVIPDCPDYIREELDRICGEREYQNVSYRFETGKEIGEGFTSKIVRVIITASNIKKPVWLLYKVAPDKEKMREDLKTTSTFNHERNFYTTMVTDLESFQEDLPVADKFRVYPKCLSAVANPQHGHYFLILEDLKAEGFQNWPKEEVAEVENVKLALRQIGRYHGLFVAMREKNRIMFDKFLEMEDVSKKFLESSSMVDMFSRAYDRAIDLLEKPQHIDIYNTIKLDINNLFNACVGEQSHGDYGVVSHGDFWTNNCLYKFKPNSKIAEDIRIVDWQIMRHASPAIDVVFHIFMSTDKASRDAEYENFLKEYHNELVRTVNKLGVNPALFTMDNLRTELKRVGYYAVLVAPLYLPIALGDSSQAESLSDLFSVDANGKRIIVGMDERSKMLYKKRLEDILDDVERNDWLKPIR